MADGVPAYPVFAAWLAANGIAHAELAGALDPPLHPKTVSNIMRGVHRPSAQLKQKIADYLGADVDELFALHPDIMRLVDAAVQQGFPRHIEDSTVLRAFVTLLRPSDVPKAQHHTADTASTAIQWKEPPPRYASGGKKAAS